MNEFKAIDMRIKYGRAYRNRTVKEEHTAGVTFGSETTFHSIHQFVKDMRHIEGVFRRCFRKGLFVEIELTSSAYAVVDGRVTTKKFDRWFYTGTPDDETGILLSPETKYTPENLAIWLDFNESVIKQLSSYSFL